MKNNSLITRIAVILSILGTIMLPAVASAQYYSPYSYDNSYYWYNNYNNNYNYSYGRTASEELSQVTDLDGNVVGSFSDFRDTTYDNNYGNYNNYNSNYNGYCYDSANDIYYRCGTNTSSNRCYNSTTRTYYYCSSSTSTQTTRTVYIKNNLYSPSSITIKRGSIVKWVNQDNRSHSVTGDRTSYYINSSTLKLNSTYQKTFTTTGTFYYHDKYNTNIKGKIIVTN